MRILVDLHTHTIASGHAYSTVKEMVQAASYKELEAIAITEHGLDFPGGPHEYYFYNMGAIPQYLCGVEILKGVEANIINEKGELDIPTYLIKKLDIVIAGFHYNCGYESSTEEKNTEVILKALNNRYVHFISHPGNPEFKVDLEKLAYEAQRLGKALEINNSSFTVSRLGSSSRCKELLTYAKKYNTLLVINSDAHIYTAVGEFSAAIDAVKSADIGIEQIINANIDRVKKYILKHKRRLQMRTA